MLTKALWTGVGSPPPALVDTAAPSRSRVGRVATCAHVSFFAAKPGARVQFGARCVLDNDLTIEAGGRLEIGARTIFGHHGTLASRALLIIGEDCLIAEFVSIRDHDHCFDSLEIPVREQGETVAPVRIGRNVWIGAKATITKGVTIGDHAIIGANAVVTRDIPAHAIAGGVPARVIRWRTAEKVKEVA